MTWEDILWQIVSQGYKAENTHKQKGLKWFWDDFYDNYKLQFIVIIFSFSALPLSGWNVTVLMSSHFGFTIQLSALHTYIDRTASFYLTVLKTPAGYVLAVETFPGSATTEDITGLRPSTMYRFCVYGIDETGQAYKTSESLASTTDGKLYILHCFLFMWVLLYATS